MSTTYVTLTEAKEQLSIDEGLVNFDDRIIRLIGQAEDWAENYTQRSLGELMQLDSPSDESQVPLPDPVDPIRDWPARFPRPDYLNLQIVDWQPAHYRHYWAHVGPVELGTEKPLRRDVKGAILMYMESLFDRNTENFLMLQQCAQRMLDPYRIGIGV